MPATSVLSFAASRPFSGSSTIRFESTTSAIVDEVTSTVGDWPDTVTDSAIAPTSIATFTVRFSFACSKTPFR